MKEMMSVPPFDKFDLDDLSNNISIYDTIDVFNSDLDILDLDKYCLYDDINTDNDISNVNDTNKYIENCSTCYYHYKCQCLAKGIDISITENYPENCWLYRDGITMKTSSDFQDDYSDMYDSFD